MAEPTNKLNPSMFRKRLITAIIAIPIILLIIFKMPENYFHTLMAVVTAIAAWEWAKLVGFEQNGLKAIYVLAVLAALFISSFIHPKIIFYLGTFVLVWATAGILLYQANREPAGFQIPGLRVIAGIILLTGFWVAIGFLKMEPDRGSMLLFFVALLVWVADSAGYIFGKLWGRSPLIPRVSPKKTWEGLFGSLLVSLLVAISFSFLVTLDKKTHWEIIALALLVVIFSVVGDLFVSLLKRLVDIKDTGNIFPGHGGMLDRLDSVIAAVIIFALGILF